MSEPDDTSALASRLHVAAIHLLRRLRREDAASSLTPAQLSAISTLIKAGEMTMTELADAEQVRPPTMTRLVQRLEVEGLVVRTPAKSDRRVSVIKATHRAWVALEKGRTARVEALGRALDGLEPSERASLEESVGLIERLLR